MEIIEAFVCWGFGQRACILCLQSQARKLGRRCPSYHPTCLPSIPSLLAPHPLPPCSSLIILSPVHLSLSSFLLDFSWFSPSCLLPPSFPHILLLSSLPSLLLSAFLWLPLLCSLSLLLSPFISLSLSPLLPREETAHKTPTHKRLSKDKAPQPRTSTCPAGTTQHPEQQVGSRGQELGRHRAGGSSLQLPVLPPSLLASHHAKKSKLLW